MSMTILDQKAAQISQGIINNVKKDKMKEMENQITKSLGVLQEQGVYALILYLYKVQERIIIDELLNLLKDIDLTKKEAEKIDSDKVHETLKYFSDNICSDIDNLFFVRDLFEQTLIYARYGAKAEQKKSERNTEDKQHFGSAE